VTTGQQADQQSGNGAVLADDGFGDFASNLV
jgi:hypothetical protein